MTKVRGVIMQPYSDVQNLTVIKEYIRIATIDKWLIIAWSLTLLRIPLLALCLYQILNQSTLVPLTILAIVISDILDGETFSFSKHHSDNRMRMYRHVFDAIGDRIVIHSTLLLAVPYYGINAYIYSTILIREIILVAVTLLPLFNQKIVIQSDKFSKIATVCIALIVINHINPLVPQIFIVIPFVLFGTLGIYRYLFHYQKC